jgi:TolB-like protein/Tfp pilus assembly protein PilF
MSFLSELKRRKVLRVGAAYIVTGWLVIQVVETILPAFGFGDSIVRYVTILLAVGLVPVLILSWAFELTPEGLKKDEDVARPASFSPRTGKTLDRVIMVALALGVAYFTVDKFVLSPQREAAETEQVATRIEQAREAGRTQALIESFGDRSIAVLPFVNMSPDPDQEYFSDGISEELLNLLAGIPELRVISRTSAFAFKGKDINLVDVAERLDVAHILEGSVRKSGDRLRITAQLIEARTDTHLWSETYDRDMGDIFAIQDDIAAVVVDRLKLELLGDEPSSRNVDPRAYELVLRARPLHRSGNAERLEEAVELYQQALVIDPDYAVAWDELAITYDNMTTLGVLPVDEGVLLARRANERALELDPDFVPSLANLAWIELYYDNDPAAAARYLERAQALDPDNTATLGVAAVLLNSLGRVRDALRINQWILARDPLRTSVRHNTSVMLFLVGRFDDAIASWRELLRQQPDGYGTHYFIGLSLLYQERIDAALAEFEQERYELLAAAGRAMTFHALGRSADHEAELDGLIEEWGDDAATAVARVHLYAGRVEPALDWLERAVDAGRGGQINPVDPGYRRLDGNARWNELLKRIGKAPEQLDAIEFDGRLPADCDAEADCVEPQRTI